MPVMRYGYKASAEQFGPRDLLDFAERAVNVGLETVAISDHFQPWRHSGGHAPNALVWLGAASERLPGARLGTSVLTPTLRYHPSIIAQAFATLGTLRPGQVFLGVGTGEAMNELPATGNEWPGARERRHRLAEAVTLIRLLWTEERVDFDGEWYRAVRATVYDRPDEPVPIYIAAGAPLASKLAGRAGDGFISTSGKAPELYHELTDAVREGAEAANRDPDHIQRMLELKVSYDHDVDFAREACRWWAALALTAEEKAGTDDPIEMERLADAALDRAHTRFIVSKDPDEIVERIAPYVELGFTELVFHAPGPDQRRFLDQFGRDVLPRLRDRFG